MVIKILILIEFVALLVCLSSGFIFLMKDIGVPESKRTLYALGARIGIAILLMLTIAYGISTGVIKNKQQWNQPRPAPQSTP